MSLVAPGMPSLDGRPLSIVWEDQSEWEWWPPQFPTMVAGTPLPPHVPARQRTVYTLEKVLQSLRVSTAISEKLSDDLENLPSTFGAVHFRNTDYRSDFDKMIGEVKQAVAATGVDSVVWCTDDVESVELARQALPFTSVINANNLPSVSSLGATNLHFLSEELLDGYGLSRNDLVVAALHDLAALSMATWVVHSTSSTSWKRFVQIMRREPALLSAFFGVNVKKS